MNSGKGSTLGSNIIGQMPGALIALVKFTVVAVKQNPQELDAFASSFSQVQLGMPQV